MSQLTKLLRRQRPSAQRLAAQRSSAKPAASSAPKESLNLRGASLFPPGHFYSPLIDIESLTPGAGDPYDGPECWESLDLRVEAQREFYLQRIAEHTPFAFPKNKSDQYRYYYGNNWFPLADAITLSTMIRAGRPKRIVEVGSGFSTAVMLDTLDRVDFDVELACVEPWPARLFEVLWPQDRSRLRIQESIVQQTPMDEFTSLEAGDILFIDSSHVAKIGSDVVHLYLRVLPKLAPGVIVHVHDIFYPQSYPTPWVEDGNAWNESLFLRAFLACNPMFETVAFNAYASHTFGAEIGHPAYTQNQGGSFWMRRVA